MNTNLYWVFFTAVVQIRLGKCMLLDEMISYEGAQVWRTQLRTDSDRDIVKKLSSNLDISVWTMHPYHADYLVTPTKMDKIYSELLARKLNRSVLIYDVQRKIEDTRTGPIKWTETSLRIGHRLNWKTYPTLNVIEEYYEYLSENFRSICQVSNIGNSVENKPIKMITISNGNPRNQPIIIVAGQHAREWTSVSSALYIANQIVTKFDTQPDYVIAKNWYIVPLLNPDGYEYTHTRDRLWRKNRRKNSRSECPGVDLNRNYPKHWAVPGITEHYDCAEDYSGPFPLSEPETIALLNLLDIVHGKPRAFIDLHAYGQFVIYPWGIKDNEALRGREFLISTATGIKEALAETYNATYKSGTAPSLMYPVTGSAIDWFYSKGAQLSYAIEGRDTGKDGFLLPPSVLEKAGKDMLTAVKHVAKVLDPVIVMRDGEQHRWF